MSYESKLIDDITAAVENRIGLHYHELRDIIAAQVTDAVYGLRQTAEVNEANGDKWRRFTLAIGGHPAAVSPEDIARELLTLRTPIKPPIQYVGKTIEDEDFGRGEIIEEGDETVLCKFTNENAHAGFVVINKSALVPQED